MLKVFKKNHFYLAAFSVILFLILLPLSLQIDFSQNDDWVYYKMVQNFLSGDFRLDPISAPTFYAQGVLGMIFAFLFGINHLPVLSLFIAVINFFIFVILVHKILKDFFMSVLAGLMLFVNPLYIYSIWGFMTEQYFLFFTTMALYFIYKYTLLEGSKKDFILANLFILISFFVRQLAFVTSLAFGIYLLFKKQWKSGFIQLGLFVLLYLFYYLVFPKTAEMFEKPLEIKNLLELSYTYSLIYAILLYICAFCFPLMLFLAKPSTNKFYYLGFLILVVVGYFFLNKYFDPHKLAWGEFYYLDNVLERKGFFPRGIDGTKYFFRGIYDLYRHWDTLSKIFASFLLTYLILKPKKLFNVFFVFIAVYICVMVLTQKVYDRYLLILVEVSILFLVSISDKVHYLKKCLLISFIAFLAFYSYQFSMDFILLNSYVWSKGNEISKVSKITKNDIMGTNSWKLLNPNPKHDYKYIFTFDSYITKPELKCCWTLVENKQIEFPLSFFIEPRIYLYKSNKL